ncbi:MAG: DEAD/DEAH box helicase [Proteobacteria bacterium]|nr:DEAD/DEAH box helicase [Pseudomonadota bacterium]MBU1648348.1 DEAD/DEAH box helicase [Pseudomonadota bacterium]
MKILNLEKYSDSGVLNDLDDADFVARKFGDENTLDFTGVTKVTSDFLDRLFAGQSPESLDGRISGHTDTVDKELSDWIERQLVKPVEKISKKKKESEPENVSPTGKTKKITYKRQDVEGEKYTPTRLVSRLRHQLESYIESAYPLSDPIIVKARRCLLREAQHGRLIAQEAFVETTPRYKGFDGSYDTLGLPDHIGSLFKTLSETNQQWAEAEEQKPLLYPGMYQHQAEALQEFLINRKDIIVATGTGSGKTECFMLPILGALYDEASTRPQSFAEPGVRVLILYPMNALVNDQLSRLRLLFGDPSLHDLFHQSGKGTRHPLFGMYTGRTPYPGPRTSGKDNERVRPLLEYYTNMDADLRKELQRRGRYPAKNLHNFYARELEEERVYRSGKKTGQTYKKNNWDRRLHTDPSDSELLIRQEMVRGAGSNPGNAPDILITNYSMLEYMLLRPFERPIFKQTADWLKKEGNQFILILDEAHMYRGAKGAEVSFLLRRLCARLGINDKPEKLRVICTSASLGKGEKAKDNIRLFAADLTGKRPDNFVPITGDRSVPEKCAPAESKLADILAAVDLDSLHASAEPETLLVALKPLFQYFSMPCTETTDGGILRHLNEVLFDKPFVNLLLKETSVEAKSLSKLAAAIFLKHPRAVKATEVLLTLGAIARKNRDEPGIVPARIHIMFRGLNALYGCINTTCSGRQEKPGEQAMVGKLFSDPRMTCDTCGSRVLELASCRSCGSPYFYAYFPSNSIEGLDFLWGETQGNLIKVELLPAPPRHATMAEEIRVHLKTGYVDIENTFPENETRSLWLFRNTENEREAAFSHCPMCQSPSSRASSRISNFRTKGEQPFTALIEAQFSEQPPQSKDESLPNRGRKVLVFSDGRQKAARLAPALEHSHSRDLFRQVLAIASHKLSEHAIGRGMNLLYPAILSVCNDKGVNIFPSPADDEDKIFLRQLQDADGKSLEQLVQDLNQGFLQPTLAYAKHLFSEMTDRYYSLNALGIASVEEDPVLNAIIFRKFPEVGLTQPEKEILFRSWIRLQLEMRRFLPQGADIYQMGEGWDRPDGIDINNPTHVVPQQYRQYLSSVFENKDYEQRVIEWLLEHVRASQLLRLQNNRYFLQPLGLHLSLKLEATWLCCSDCGRLYSDVIRGICPACLGQVNQIEGDYLETRTGFYREQISRAFDEKSFEPFGLVTAEHSAQLNGKNDETAFNKTEQYELRFQDIPFANEPPIDVLSCTTTMEVGIDIGSLSGVALRNVPPHVSNYQQRAGRAGRRGRSIASVITYAHGTSHDAHFYNNPGLIISGDVELPVVYVENQQVLRRHICAFLIQRFFHEKVLTGTETYQLFESLGTVEQFLSGTHECSFGSLLSWLEDKGEQLKKEIATWAPVFSYGLNQNIEEHVRDTIQECVIHLVQRLRETLPIGDYANREELEGVVRESLERQLEETLLGCLIGRAILPRYAFPTDVVAFYVSRRKYPGDPAYKRTFEYEPQRDLQIALSEFAPGSSLTIDKHRFVSAAIYSPYAPDVEATLERAQSYTACVDCGYVSLEEIAETMIACPCCSGENLSRQSFITPEGFAPDINIRPEVDRGEAPVWAGMTSKAQLEVQEPPSSWDEQLYSGRLALLARPQRLVTVNKGINNRGFMVCPDCGRTEPVFGENYPNSIMFRGGVQRQHNNPLEQGVICSGQARGPYFLGHQFPTDVLLMQVRMDAPFICSTADTPLRSGRPGRAALASLVEAISLAASRTLQIEEGELSGNWSPVLGAHTNDAQLFLYDLLPGGAGYTRLVKERLTEVLDQTEKLLSACDCETSCYNCLRHFANNFYHSSLDRKLALALLSYIMYGRSPELTTKDKSHALDSLKELLRLKEIEYYSDPERNGVRIPLVIKREDNSEIWVDVHHPLVDPEALNSCVQEFAEREMVEYCTLDTFTLMHDLPSSFAALQL